jgi:hypothetical protein
MESDKNPEYDTLSEFQPLPTTDDDQGTFSIRPIEGTPAGLISRKRGRSVKLKFYQTDYQLTT